MKDFDILYVDDDRDILQMVGEYLRRAQYRVDVVDNGIDAFEMVKTKGYDLVFTDFKMPEFSGLDLLKGIKGVRPDVEVVIVTGHGTMESAIEAMKVGAYDYLQKPFKLDQLRVLIENLKARRVAAPKKSDAPPAGERFRYGDLIGMSAPMRRIYDAIDAMSDACPNVMIQGESGTGKELTARLIHRFGPRSDGDFVLVNCQGMAEKVQGGSLDDVLVEAVGGTSASVTLFLNEVGDLPAAGQEAMLDFLPDTAGDGSGPLKGRVQRVIASSSRSLSDAVERSEFNEALLAALAGVSLQMPPLRERKEDLCLLIARFLDRFNPPDQPPIAGVSFNALDVLLRYHWPGNVIQLENVIERAVALGVAPLIDVDDLPSEIRTFDEISRIG